jgi:UrcA family protein
MSNSILMTLLAAATLATGAGSAPTAFAADQNTVSTIVKFSDLNLASQEGAKTLLHRINHAARVVCEPEPNFSSTGEVNDWRNCIANATSEAVSRLDSPMVTAQYSGGQPSKTQLAQAH